MDMEKLSKEYVKLLEEEVKVKAKLQADKPLLDKQIQLTQLMGDANILQAEIHALAEPHDHKTKQIKARLSEITEEFKNAYDGETKEINTEVLTATYRETKSLKIIDEEKAVKVLIANNKVAEGMKGFSLSFMRKLKDVGILDDDTAAYDVKVNVSLKVKEEIK